MWFPLCYVARGRPKKYQDSHIHLQRDAYRLSIKLMSLLMHHHHYHLISQIIKINILLWMKSWYLYCWPRESESWWYYLGIDAGSTGICETVVERIVVLLLKQPLDVVVHGIWSDNMDVPKVIWRQRRSYTYHLLIRRAKGTLFVVKGIFKGSLGPRRTIRSSCSWSKANGKEK